MTDWHPTPFTDRPVDQVGILVPELNASAARYAAWFGVRSWRVYRYDAGNVREFEHGGRPATYSFRLALSNTSPQIELIEPPNNSSPYDQWVEDHGHGIHHLGYFVESVSDVRAAMTQAGYEPLQYGTGYGMDGDGGFAYYDLTAELGVVVEAIEVPRRRRVPDDLWHLTAG